jgi:hypothetical protein
VLVQTLKTRDFDEMTERFPRWDLQGIQRRPPLESTRNRGSRLPAGAPARSVDHGSIPWDEFNNVAFIQLLGAKIGELFRQQPQAALQPPFHC